MRRLVLTLLSVCIAAATVNASVTGFAYLDNQTNHSGIRVYFLPQSGTAILDSAFTASDGAYSVNLNGGLYKVVFKKSGYQETYYQNSNSIAIGPNDILQAVILLPGNVRFVSGSVSGTWSKDTVYVALASLYVNQGEVLNIEAGTVIKFSGKYKLTVNGMLNVHGNDTGRVVFTSGLANPVYDSWTGIEATDGAVVNIDYGLFEYAVLCVYAQRAKVRVTNSEFRFFYAVGTYCLDDTPHISQNYFHSFSTGADYASHAIAVEGLNLTATVQCNTIDGGNGHGIIANGNGIIANNIIRNIKSFDRGNGISISNDSKALFSNNYITECSQGFRIGSNGDATFFPSPSIINNTITNCDNYGIAFGDQYGHGKVVNNIISGCPVAITGNTDGCQFCYSGPDVVSNNLFYDNDQKFSAVTIPGLGYTVNVNVNGDAIDSYYNLYQDPEFHNGTAPDLSSASPCYNAGDITYSSDIGFNSNFTCEVPVLPDTVPAQNLKFKLFPNPAVENVTIEIDTLVNDNAQLMVSHINGTVFIDRSIKNSVSINLSELGSGLYVVTIRDGAASANKQKLLVTH